MKLTPSSGATHMSIRKADDVTLQGNYSKSKQYEYKLSEFNFCGFFHIHQK
jgi:hypothetical protein